MYQEDENGETKMSISLNKYINSNWYLFNKNVVIEYESITLYKYELISSYRWTITQS